MPDGIGSALSSFGSTLGSIPGAVSNWFSPGAASAATGAAAGAGAGGIPSVPTTPDNPGLGSTGGLPSDGSSGGGMAAPSPSPSYFSGGSPTDPNVPVDPTSLALPAAVGMGPVAAPGAMPAETALSTLGTNVTDPVTNQPLATSMGDPASQGWAAQFLKSLGTGKGGTTIGGIGNLVEAITRWNAMRTLQNPSALASGAGRMYQPMSKAFKRAIISPVTAAAQETGQINAPGLYSQSVATALAPYQYQMQMQAMQDYIEALRASGAAYPVGGVPSGGYGGGDTSGSSSASIFGGGGSSS